MVTLMRQIIQFLIDLGRRSRGQYLHLVELLLDKFSSQYQIQRSLTLTPGEQGFSFIYFFKNIWPCSLLCCWSYTGISALSQRGGSYIKGCSREELDPEYLQQTAETVFSLSEYKRTRNYYPSSHSKTAKSIFLPWVISSGFLLSWTLCYFHSGDTLLLFWREEGNKNFWGAVLQMCVKQR